MTLDDWLFSDASPRDFYQLSGVKRFDPNREVVLRNLRDVVRRLMQYERHENRDVMKRAMYLQRDAAQADRTLRDHDLLRNAHLQMLKTLADEWKAAGGGDPAAWLIAQDVHPDRISLIAAALPTDQFDKAAQALDWIDVAEAVQETLDDDDDDDSTDEIRTPDDLLPGRALPPSGPSPSSIGRTAPKPLPAKGRPIPVPIPMQATEKTPSSIPPPSPSPPGAKRPVVVPPVAVASQTPAPARRSRSRWYVVAALLIGVAGSGAVWWNKDVGLVGSTASVPSLGPIADIIADEETLLDFALPIVAEESDEIAVEDLELSGKVPTDFRFLPAERRFSWKPTETDGPGKFPLQVRFRRTRWNAPDEVRTFNIVVREVNRPPQVRTPLKLYGSPSTTVSGLLDVFDPDVPANHVRMELVDAKAKGAVNHPMAGHVMLFPDEKAVGPRTLKVRLIDDGTPPASSETTVTAELSTYSTSSIVSTTPSTPSPTPAPSLPVASATASPPPMASETTVVLRPSLAEPALTGAVKVYECDFDVEVPEFPVRSGGMNVAYAGGRLRINAATTNTGPIGMTIGNLSSTPVSDFACEMVFRATDTISSDFGFMFPRLKGRCWLSLLRNRYQLGETTNTLPAGLVRRNADNTLFFVVSDRQATAYLNGDRLAGPVPLEPSATTPSIVEIFFGGGAGASCEIDRVALWRLPPGVSPMPSNTTPVAPSPPVDLASDRAPDLSRVPKLVECTFDAETTQFPSRSGSLLVSTRDGVLRLEREGSDTRRFGYALGELSEFKVTDYACEIRFRFVGDGDCTIGLWVGDSRNLYTVANNGQDRCSLIRTGGSLPLGSMSARRNDWHSMLLVVRDRKATGYFDGVRVGGPVEISAETVFPAEARTYLIAPAPMACEIDHYNLWNLAAGSVATSGPPGVSPVNEAPPAEFKPDYDSVDLPPLQIAASPMTLLPAYCKPDEVAGIAPELAINEDLGTRGLRFLLTPATSADPSVRIWDVVPEQQKVAKPAVAQLQLKGGALEFRWSAADPLGEQLRNCVLLSKNPTRPAVVFRKFIRLPPIAVDVKNGKGTTALCNAAGMARLDGLRWQITGTAGFPTGTAMPNAALGGGEQAVFTYNPGQIQLQWKLNLTKVKTDLHCAQIGQAVDGKRIVTLTAPLIRSETNSLAKQQAAVLQQIKNIITAKALLELQRPFLSTQSQVDNFNAQVNQHNANVARLQIEADKLKLREDVFNQVVGTVEKMEGLTSVRLRVFFNAEGRQYDLIRAE